MLTVETVGIKMISMTLFSTLIHLTDILMVVPILIINA